MKILNFRKKLVAAFAAAGLLTPGAALAADLNANLIVNPSFENVDEADTGPFTSVRILDWVDADADEDDTFDYPYSSAYSGDPAHAARSCQAGYHRAENLPPPIQTLGQARAHFAHQSPELVGPALQNRNRLFGHIPRVLNVEDVLDKLQVLVSKIPKVYIPPQFAQCFTGAVQKPGSR